MIREIFSSSDLCTPHLQVLFLLLCRATRLAVFRNENGKEPSHVNKYENTFIVIIVAEYTRERFGYDPSRCVHQYERYRSFELDQQ